MQISVPATTRSNSGSTNGKHPVFPVGHMLPFVLVTVLFFLWGMSNNLTDILVQQFKKSFELSKFSAQLVSTANFTGYFCMAIPAALVMRRWGYKAGMVMGLTLLVFQHWMIVVDDYYCFHQFLEIVVWVTTGATATT